MTRSEEVDAAWAQVDRETNELKARVDVLIADINRTATEGLSPAQTENVLVRLTSLAGVLGATGHNPAQPIPPIPEPPAMPGPFQP